MRTTWIIVFFALFGTNLSKGLSPPPPFELTFYVGTAGCPAKPTVVMEITQERAIYLTLGQCAVTPLSGTLSFSSSDSNAVLPASFNYNALTMQPGAISPGNAYFRTPGIQTITARDAANNIVISETFNVLPVGILLEVGCVSLANARPPTITRVGSVHTLSVFNCLDTATPALSVFSTDPIATFPTGVRVFPPAFGVPQLYGDIAFQTPGLRTVSLRDGNGITYATHSFNVLADGAIGPAQPVPVGSPFGMALLALLLAGLAVRLPNVRGKPVTKK